MPQRRAALQSWLDRVSEPGLVLVQVAGDASQRRYFRVRLADGSSRVVMDAPPGRESAARFVALAGTFATLGVHVPRVDAADSDQGFVLLEDLGERHYLDVLDAATADRLYGDALSTLLAIQARGRCSGLPAYDRELLERELGIFNEWLVQRHLGLALTSAEERMLSGAFERLVANALEQPRVLVHRDYHSRNLLVGAPPLPGVIDFQDAVAGPVTYDLVSLLRDCYIAWPAARVDAWAWEYFERAVRAGVLLPAHRPHFLRWFDLMGVQRHLKAAGIFARLLHRDGRDSYLRDVPRTLDYVVEVARRRPELADLGAFVAERVRPALSPGSLQ